MTRQLVSFLLSAAISRKYISMGEHDDKYKIFPLINIQWEKLSEKVILCSVERERPQWGGQHGGKEPFEYLEEAVCMCVCDAYICITCFVWALGPFSILNLTSCLIRPITSYPVYTWQGRYIWQSHRLWEGSIHE